jgi:laminin alpha 1/2
MKQSCDVHSGQCECKEGFSGRACDYCDVGYFGYPNCQKCNCDIRGSIANEYDEVIDCDDNGQCPCKELATGLKCDECRESTFGLSQANPHGCTRCFCFGRSQICTQNDMIWGQVRMMGQRNITVHYIHHGNSQDNVDYVILSHLRNHQIYRESARIYSKNNLQILPGKSGDITIGTRHAFRYPMYVELPDEFVGDKTSSYGGFLNFSIQTFDYRQNYHEETLRKFPLIQMQTHHHLTLNYFHTEPYSDHDTFNAVIHESYWKYAANNYNISRAIMMTALQNVKRIFVRISTSSDFVAIT